MTGVPTRRTATSQRVIPLVCGVASLCVAIFMFVLVKRMTVDVPFSDEWAWTQLIVSLRHGTLSISDLWQQHNEHRIFFPELIVLALDRVGGWSQVRECLTSVLLVALGQLVVLQLLRATFRLQLAMPLWLIDSLFLFSPQSQNWTWGFQIAWFLTNTATLAAVWMLSRRTLSATAILSAGACAIVASYSSAFGLNVLLSGLVILLLRPDVRRPTQLGWIVFSAAAVALYLYGLHSTAAIVGGEAPRDAAVLTHYVFSYLGVPLGSSLGLRASTIFGMIVSALFIASAIVIIRTPRRDDSVYDRSVPWFGLGAFALATAVMVALGRADKGPGRVLIDNRYETEAAMFWIATVGLCADAIDRADLAWKPVTLRLVAALACSFGVWLYMRNAVLGIGQMRVAREQRREGAALVLGELFLYDIARLRSVHDSTLIERVIKLPDTPSVVTRKLHDSS